MKSMTAYGYTELNDSKYLLIMEIKSVNSRYLDIVYTAPSCLSAYEQVATEAIRQHAARGHIELKVRLEKLESALTVNVDQGAARAYAKALKIVQEIAHAEGLELNVTASDILGHAGVLVAQESATLDTYRDGLDACLASVLDQFDAAKLREGLVTATDLRKQITEIQDSLAVVRANVATLEDLIKDNLRQRIAEMLGDQNYDNNRILTEVAVMLNRFTINEEVVRLGAHIDAFLDLLDLDQPVGKKMDFLCQEMNREINTIGSKSQLVEVNFQVVKMKDCLENIREQVRNIE